MYDKRHQYKQCINPDCNSNFFSNKRNQKFCNTACCISHHKKLEVKKRQFKKIRKKDSHPKLTDHEINKIRSDAKFQISYCIEKILEYKKRLYEMQSLYHDTKNTLNYRRFKVMMPEIA